METQTVKFSFRLPEEDRRELREILLRGGLTVQDFGNAIVARALGRRKEEVDPLGGMSMLRTQSPRVSFRAIGRKMILGELPEA